MRVRKRVRGADAPLRIAVVGTRGLPATYGGVERHVEEITSRLAARGHDVTVYCRTGYNEATPEQYRGVRLVHLPTVAGRGAEAIVHSASASMRTLGRGFDVVAYHAVGPGLTAPLPRYLGGTAVVQTVHGLDGDRAKWGGTGRAALQVGTWMSARVPHETIVVSEALREHYAERYGRSVRYVPNGVDEVAPLPPGPALARFGLTPGSYVLYVGRLVPEKAPDRLVRAFQRAGIEGKTLLVVGGSSHTDAYVAQLHALVDGDPRVLMPGYVYGQELQELYAQAAAFVLPSDLEGLPLTLLEAASYGLPVLASDIPPHRQVLRGDGPGRRLVEAGSEQALVDGLRRLLDPARLPEERAGGLRLRADVLRRFAWDEVALATERIYRLAAGQLQRGSADAGTGWEHADVVELAGGRAVRDRAGAADLDRTGTG